MMSTTTKEASQVLSFNPPKQPPFWIEATAAHQHNFKNRQVPRASLMWYFWSKTLGDTTIWSIMAFSILALSIVDVIVTLSIKDI